MLTIFLAGCIDTSKPVELRTDMNMKMEGAIRLEGPIVIQMSAPETRYEGTYVSKEMFDEIDLGTTSRLWVVTVLGEPDRKTDMSDGSELLVWGFKVGAIVGQMVKVVDIGGGGKDESRPATLTTVVRFTDGVAQAKWRG